MKNNPFLYSLDNKRYHTINYYFRTKYNSKVAKIPLNAGFSCPNRDGTKSTKGCTFCSSKGSGDSILGFHKNLKEQYDIGLKRMQKKWPDCKGFAYFQSYSNTYAPLAKLKEIYDPFYDSDSVLGISIATRADCIDPETIAYLNEKAKSKETWLEIGLQSIHEKTIQNINRCHDTQQVWSILDQLKNTNIKTCLHIINSLPGETKEDMLETAIECAKHPMDAIKIHMLHLIQGTQMANDFQQHPFHLLELDEYVDIVIRQLEVLPSECIIERLTGDGLASDLIAPLWTIKKTIVTNEIDKEMVRRNTWQGKKNKGH